jgi:hypothetical protein
MIFNAFQYLWPPRPKKAIPPNLLKYYEDQKWIAQYKKNGTCTVLYIDPNKKMIVKTRHNTEHKAWHPSKEFAEQFSALPGEGWYVFAGELLHNKTPLIKDTLYLFDALVDNGEYLIGTTLKERIARLHDIFPKQARSINRGYYVSMPKLWIAETIKSNFLKVYKNLTFSEDEGLVLKDPNARLNLCSKADSNAAWQIKCRLPTKNHTF